MRKILNWIRNDFNSVRLALGCLLNRDCPVWVVAIWYAIWIPILIVLSPILIVWYYWLYMKLKKS